MCGVLSTVLDPICWLRLYFRDSCEKVPYAGIIARCPQTLGHTMGALYSAGTDHLFLRPLIPQKGEVIPLLVFSPLI